jgi:hypothetical protein
MRRVRRWMWAGLIVAGLAGRFADGQAPGSGAVAGTSVSPATSVGGVLRGLASRAGVIFVGQVQRIVAKEGVVEITFLVEKPLLGVASGTYVEREWAGRWSGGQQRYRLGQRAMFFLHTPNTAGLSSPVGGMAGIVSLVPMGVDGTTLLDVRMLATRVVRNIGLPIADAGFGAIALADAETVVGNWQGTEQLEPARRLLPAGVQLRASVEKNALPGEMNGRGLLEPEEKVDAQR